MTRSADRDLPPAPIDRLLGFGGRDAVALIGREGSLTYQGLDALAGRVAAGLVRAGAKTGDRVASWMGKTLASADRKSVVSGKGVSVRVDLGGRRSIKK